MGSHPSPRHSHVTADGPGLCGSDRDAAESQPMRISAGLEQARQLLSRFSRREAHDSPGPGAQPGAETG
jgi:hypothetical protein